MSRGDAIGRGQPIKPPFDLLEPTIDIAPKNFGGVRSKNPKVPRTTRRDGNRVGHGKRLLTIGGHPKPAHSVLPVQNHIDELKNELLAEIDTLWLNVTASLNPNS